MSTETKRKSAFVGLFVMVAVVLVAITFIVTKSSVATSYSVASPGMIHRAFVSYKDSDTVTIQPGYGECSLSYWEITSPVDHDMTSLATGEDFHYIYIDDVNSVYPTPTIKDSTVEPTWSDSKLGWYNGYDRCIGAVWSPDSGATIQTFLNNELNEYSTYGYTKVIAENFNPTGTWMDTTLDCSDYVPVNATHVRVRVYNIDSDSTCTVAVQEKDTGCSHYHIKAYMVWNHLWATVALGPSRNIVIMGSGDDDNYLTCRVYGWRTSR